jgi:hypothetical protein
MYDKYEKYFIENSENAKPTSPTISLEFAKTEN